MSSDKKVIETKNLPFDEIYLKQGLGFELRPQIGSLEPKNAFLGVIFGGLQIKNPPKPVPKNLYGCLELKKSLISAFLAI